MPQKTWVVGEEVLASDFNTYVQNQVVATFASTTARDTWASPPNGALCVTTDTNTLWQRRAGVWAPPIGHLVAANTTAYPDLARTSTGLVDVLTLDMGTFPYPTAVYVESNLVAGFSSGVSSYTYDLVVTLGSVTIPAGGAVYGIQAPAAFWAPAATLAWSFAVGAGQATSWKARINVTNVGAGTVHTAGYARTMVFAT